MFGSKPAQWDPWVGHPVTCADGGNLIPIFQTLSLGQFVAIALATYCALIGHGARVAGIGIGRLASRSFAVTVHGLLQGTSKPPGEAFPLSRAC